MRKIWLRFRSFQQRKQAQTKEALKESGLLRAMAIYAFISPLIVNPLAVVAAAGYVPKWLPIVGWIVGHLNAWVVLPIFLAYRLRDRPVPVTQPESSS